MAKMDDARLLNQIEQMERQAVGYFTGEIAQEQAKALDYYLGKPFGTEEEGRSSVVSSDVWDVVEGMTPQVLRPFVATSDVVKFNPLQPGDEQQAQDETDYINFIATQRNDSFIQLAAWVKTGLLQKNGVVKYWWEKTRKTRIDRYFGIGDDVFTAMLADKDVTVLEHSEEADDTGSLIHDVTLRTIEEVGYAKYAVIPPEEFLISKDADSPNPQQARFVEHRRKLTLSDLRAMGYDVEDDLADSVDDLTLSQQYIARRNEEESASTNINEMLDLASREVMFREVYIQVDYDGDGIAELRRVCVVGETMLANEETEEIPFCSWTPYIQPFKFYGRCPADEAIEIQAIKSTLWRQSLDNIYTINNNRNYVSDKVNLDDLLDNQIAGIVRVSADVVGNHVMPAPVTPIGGVVQTMIEYLDTAKENRTGFTRYSQGMDADSLNKTATGIRIIKAAADARLELISRAFAEQGLAPLMKGLHRLCRRHAQGPDVVKLGDRFLETDPRQWAAREDMTVSVGLGNADQQMQLQGIQMLMQTQQQLHVAGIVSPQNLYNSAAQLVQVIGRKDPSVFFTQPDKMPPPPQPPENPKLHFMAADLEIRDKQHSLEVEKFLLDKRRVDILDRDSLVAADVKEAQIALQAELQGHNMGADVLQAVQGIQKQLGEVLQKGADYQLKAQGQAHGQTMAEAQHGLAVTAQDQSAKAAEQSLNQDDDGQA